MQRRSVWAKLTELGLGQEREAMQSFERRNLESMKGMKDPALLRERGTSRPCLIDLTFYKDLFDVKTGTK